MYLKFLFLWTHWMTWYLSQYPTPGKSRFRPMMNSGAFTKKLLHPKIFGKRGLANRPESMRNKMELSIGKRSAATVALKNDFLEKSPASHSASIRWMMCFGIFCWRSCIVIWIIPADILFLRRCLSSFEDACCIKFWINWLRKIWTPWPQSVPICS